MHEPFRSQQTRPDILSGVRAVARYCSSPKRVHWEAALRIVMYVKGTSEYGITFQRGGGLDMEMYVDSGYASKATDRRSVSGVVVMCAGACSCRGRKSV